MTHLRTVLCVSALSFGLAATAANASETRNTNFLFACDGTNKTITFSATGLGNAASRFIQGAEISLFENHGGLQYIILRAQGNANFQLLTMSTADNRVFRDFTGFFSVPNVGGTIQFTIDGVCNSGAGQIQGVVTVAFFS